MTAHPKVVVLGGGVTGLAAAVESAGPAFEAVDGPGGICRSYYVRPGDDQPLHSRPENDGAYRFEIGGGHWLFGGDPETVSWLNAFSPLKEYERQAVVRVGRLDRTVSYPLQAHLEGLGGEWQQRVAREQAGPGAAAPDESATMADWLRSAFGESLSELFFLPFHDRYTAGLTTSIAPQDAYKTPLMNGRGYNTVFRYPVDGLDRLADRIAVGCDIRYNKKVIAIDVAAGVLHFEDGSEYGFDLAISTLPLHVAIELTGVEAGPWPADPYTSVLVLNIGAVRGGRCPDAHWQYEPDSRSGFHRVGFYSNVDADFLPAGCRGGSHVSMYVETGFAGGAQPETSVVKRLVESVVEELQEREYIGAVEAIHPSWVDVAYTWRRPRSAWPQLAVDALARARVMQVGRYARWRFQGIAESISAGRRAGRDLCR